MNWWNLHLLIHHSIVTKTWQNNKLINYVTGLEKLIINVNDWTRDFLLAVERSTNLATWSDYYKTIRSIYNQTLWLTTAYIIHTIIVKLHNIMNITLKSI